MRRRVLQLRVGRETLRAETLSRGVVMWASEARYTTLNELADAIPRLVAEPAQPCRRLAVVLERPTVQVRTLGDLPPVKPRALAALVAHQAGRFFRKNGEPLATDAVWVVNGNGRAARAAAVEEPLLQAIFTGARAAGLTVERIVPAGEVAPLALLPTAEHAARQRAEQVLVRRLALGATTAWLVAGALFVVRLGWERRTVDRELAALSAPVAAVLAARRELREAEQTVRAVADAGRTRGVSLAVLASLTGALPDSAVLTSLTWRSDGTGVLSGSARRSADVVAHFDRAGVLPDPRLEGAVVRESIGGREWERFTILFGPEPGRGIRDGLGSTP